MKKQNLISAISLVVLMAVLFSSTILAQNEPKQEKNQIQNQVKREVKTQNKEHGNQFVDLNADGYNDNAPDVDGDGIPNGRDEDYAGTKIRNNGRGFVDLNGDGLNDNAFDSDGDGIPNGKDSDFIKPEDGTGRKNMNGKNNHNNSGEKKYGPGNGNGNNSLGPKYGNGTGTGTCDGTGPKGNRGGRR
ncbi:MAG: hypothetical protein HXY49_03690 [Ignavibacteriaceae bacterium]|nr:hypothetical protein [Ignavibacteriaceae bacterium]